MCSGNITVEKGEDSVDENRGFVRPEEPDGGTDERGQHQTAIREQPVKTETGINESEPRSQLSPLTKGRFPSVKIKTVFRLKAKAKRPSITSLRKAHKGA